MARLFEKFSKTGKEGVEVTAEHSPSRNPGVMVMVTMKDTGASFDGLGMWITKAQAVKLAESILKHFGK